jgi:hypothetical protein
MLPIWSWPPQSDQTFWDQYNGGVWGTYPLTESNQIIRIPIAGPQPFNTLVVVRGFFPDQAIYTFPEPLPNLVGNDGHLHRQAFSVRTSFNLVGFSPGQKLPQFKHSTTAALRHRYLSPDTTFTVAVDKVDAHFGNEGQWLLNVETAFLDKNANAAAHFHFSSFVLCNEPPVDFEKNPGQLYTDPIQQPVRPDRP